MVYMRVYVDMPVVNLDLPARSAVSSNNYNYQKCNSCGPHVGDLCLRFVSDSEYRGKGVGFSGGGDGAEKSQGGSS